MLPATLCLGTLGMLDQHAVCCPSHCGACATTDCARRGPGCCGSPGWPVCIHTNQSGCLLPPTRPALPSCTSASPLCIVVDHCDEPMGWYSQLLDTRIPHIIFQKRQGHGVALTREPRLHDKLVNHPCVGADPPEAAWRGGAVRVLEGNVGNECRAYLTFIVERCCHGAANWCF